MLAVWCRPGTKRAPIELKSSRNNKGGLIYVFRSFGSWPEKFSGAVGGGRRLRWCLAGEGRKKKRVGACVSLLVKSE